MSLPFSLMKEEKRPSVLVVDDVSANLELMEAVFQRAGYTVYMAAGADPAIDIFNSCPIDIAIVDVMMPGINGFELCKILKSLTDKFFFPVILLTALNDKKIRITGIECGADDLIGKPFDVPELLTRANALLKLKKLHEELDHSENIMFSLIAAMEANDHYTKRHSARVGALADEFGAFLGFPEKEREVLKKAGMLHDIGKIGFSEKILRKPAELTEEEMNTIRKHPLIGENICRPLLSMRSILPAIRSHHERWDGNGYPDMLRGEEIPLMARILAILDSFDAMVSIRPYRDEEDNGPCLVGHGKGTVRRTMGPGADRTVSADGILCCHCGGKRLLKLGIAGGGISGSALISLLRGDPNTNLVGIYEIKQDAPGVVLARKWDLPVFTDLEAFAAATPDVVVNVTGDTEVSNKIRALFKYSVEVIEGTGARFLWEIIEKQKRAKIEVLKTMADQKIFFGLAAQLCASSTINEFLDIVLSKTLDIVDAPAGSIVVYEGGQMKPAASRGLSKKFLESNSWKILPGGITQRVFHTKELVEVPDVLKCNYTNNASLMAEKIRSVLAYPVLLRGDFAGILYIDDFKTRQYSERQKASLALVTGIVALTLDRFNLVKGLEEYRLKFLGLVEASTDIVLMTDPNGLIITCNEAARCSWDTPGLNSPVS